MSRQFPFNPVAQVLFDSFVQFVALVNVFILVAVNAVGKLLN